LAPSEPDELFHGMAPQIDHRRFIEEMNRMSDEQDEGMQEAALAAVSAARPQHELAASAHQSRPDKPRSYPQDEPRTPPQQLSGELVERLSKFMAQVEKDRVEDELRARDLEARALAAMSMAKAGNAAAQASQRIAVLSAVIALVAIILSVILN
jgi:hypothetical protein